MSAVPIALATATGILIPVVTSTTEIAPKEDKRFSDCFSTAEIRAPTKYPIDMGDTNLHLTSSCTELFMVFYVLRWQIFGFRFR